MSKRRRLLVTGAILSSQLVACSGAQRDKIAAWARPANRFLNRVVEPLQYDYKTNPTGAKLSADAANASYYYLVGQSLSSTGKSTEALTAFERAKSFDPESPSIYLALSQEYLKLNMMEEGVAAARKALELDPPNREPKLLLANLYATAKKYSEAIALFNEVLTQSPDDEEVMLYIALLEIEQKQYPQATKRLKSFLQSNPDSALAYFYLGRLAQEQGHKKDAMTAYAKSIEIRPGFVQAGTYLAALEEEIGDRHAALTTYEWLAEETDDANFHKKLGQMLLDGNDFANALKSFQNFERVEPGNLNNRMRIGLLYLELKQLGDAIKTFEWVLKEAPDSENVRYYLAAVYEQDKKLPLALKHYEKIAATSKLFADSLKRRIFILGELKRTDDAWKLLQASLKAGDKDNLKKEDLLEIGVQYLDNYGDDKKTEEFLVTALKEFPSSEKLLYLQGSLLEKKGRLDETVAVMQKILDRNPDNVGALNFVGYLLADHGKDLSQAEKMVSKALKLRPKDPFITDSLAWVHYKKGEYPTALKLLEEAFAARPDEPVIAEHLGDVLVKLGRFDQAKTYYEMALKLGPQKDADKKKIEDKLVRMLGQSCPAGAKPVDCNRLLDARRPASH